MDAVITIGTGRGSTMSIGSMITIDSIVTIDKILQMKIRK
jgi:hypothetical protein